MLEEIINATKIGLTIAAIATSLYGCTITRTSYPVAERIKKISEKKYCDGNPGNKYCDQDAIITPIWAVEFK